MLHIQIEKAWKVINQVYNTEQWVMHNEKHCVLQITCYRAVPLRIVSRAWGWIMSKQVPVSVRPWLYNCYASAFGCNLQEAAYEDLTAYKSLAEFFCRPLKDGVRPIDKVDCIVSIFFCGLFSM
jgi:hypothetical protein